MDPSKVLDGKMYAKHLFSKITSYATSLKEQYNVKPSLAIIRIGDDPASLLYVRNKTKAFLKNGLSIKEFWHPSTISRQQLLEKIHLLNEDKDFHGIILQLPLPPTLEKDRFLFLAAIHPQKDVDGLTPTNQGLLSIYDSSGLFPCTPLGCLLLLKTLLPSFSGLHAVIVGRSILVGQPMGLLLLKNNATITFAHSHTKNLSSLIQMADIVVAAIGQPHFIQQSWFKENAIVLDVGINQISNPSSKDSKIQFVGDIDTIQAQSKIRFITPVPGGIGPLTVACLAYNTLKAAQNILMQRPTFYDFDILKSP